MHYAAFVVRYIALFCGALYYTAFSFVLHCNDLTGTWESKIVAVAKQGQVIYCDDDGGDDHGGGGDDGGGGDHGESDDGGHDDDGCGGDDERARLKQWPNKVEPFTKGLALSSLWLLLLIKITRIKLVLILTMIFSLCGGFGNGI